MARRVGRGCNRRSAASLRWFQSAKPLISTCSIAGKRTFAFSATPSAPWIKVSAPAGAVQKDQRLWVSVDWGQVPAGTQEGFVKIARTDAPEAGEVSVKVQAFQAPAATRNALKGFVESDGYVSMEAEHYTRKVDVGAVKWAKIPDLGRTLSSMSVFPVTAPSATPGVNSPCLEYQMYLFSAGKAEVESIIAPSLDFVPGRAQRFAVSLDDEKPQIVEVPRQTSRNWDAAVRDSVFRLKSTHNVAEPGYHTLKFWMVDPGVVLQKLVVNLGGVKPSYLGPPESFNNANLAVGRR